MKSIEKSYTTTTEVKRSKFITHLVPIIKSKDLQKKLKIKHPKANHVVYALRYLNQIDQIVESFSDDGEPKGCAGIPTLKVLRGNKLINCAVFIVRYFGGIKLGTGGMARAYALAVKDVLSVSKLLPYEKQIEYLFETSYSQIDKTLYRLKQLGISHYERDFCVNRVKWMITGSEEKVNLYKIFRTRLV